MYCQTLPISNYNLNPITTPSSFRCINPNTPPTQFARFQSVSKFRFGFCNSTKRVSVSPNNLRKHVGLVGIRREGLLGKDDSKKDNDDDDKFYIRRCLELARKAVGCTSPNPMVGCVIVKDGKIVGEGFHPKAGQPHAEKHSGAKIVRAFVRFEGIWTSVLRNVRINKQAHESRRNQKSNKGLQFV